VASSAAEEINHNRHIFLLFSLYIIVSLLAFSSCIQ
jgi:hypothetical protein